MLTLMRLILAGAFFGVLNQYRYSAPVPSWVLPLAIMIFITAALTDMLDGHLARRWKVESQFGRIMDPVCDKVLVIGSFIYLMGSRFVIPPQTASGEFFNMVSGVYPWMVVVILARELLVTGIRGKLEGEGIKFRAVWAGKLKMVLQSLTIPLVLLIVHLDPELPGHGWMGWLRDVLVYLTVLVTAISGIPYTLAAGRAMGKAPDS